MSYSYLLAEVGAFFFPFILSFDKKVAFFKKWKYLFPAVIIASIPLLLWDIYFTHHNVWHFNSDQLIGIYIFGMPLEEYLFFFFIPYACIFIYEVLIAYFKLDWIKTSTINLINRILFLGALVMLAFFFNNIYTSVVFGFLVVILAANIFWYKWQYTGPFYLSYLVSLLPFILINGILTGSFGKAPICTYSQNEILGIRIFQIPFEDMFYSLVMMYLVVIVYEWLKRKRKSFHDSGQ